MADEALPSSTDEHVDFFDRMSEHLSVFAGKKWWFFIEVGLVVFWLPTLFLMAIDTSQLIINTATTIITFLMVAIIQNTQNRSDKAVHKKLNAIAKGLADLMAHADGDTDVLDEDIKELQHAVGLEHKESS